MFRFAQPIFLYLLLLIPILTAAYVFISFRQKQKLKKFGNADIVKGLTVGVSHFRRNLKFLLLMLALALICFLLARPQYGTRNEEIKRQGIEAIIAVDVSNSMLCQDIKPSRLDKSKMLVSKLIEQLDQDRVGLVAFAGTAITLLPVTSDYVSAKMFLDQLNPATISIQGTNMAEAITRATAGFSDNKMVGKALILITDAEDNEEGAVDAAKAAKDKDIRIFVLSVGTESGGPIPIGNGYKKDNAGNVVTTKLNETVGKQIAKASGGVYINVDQTNQAQRLLEKEIETMQKDDFASSMYSEYDEQFVAVAILLFIALLLEMCIMEKKNPLLHNFKLFKEQKEGSR
ncbi:MAG: VWA domain-containing protein [Bacteroidaceae bacterium]|nr:VWA domain-containing protein [Bacteroidaceae bacterium]